MTNLQLEGQVFAHVFRLDSDFVSATMQGRQQGMSLSHHAALGNAYTTSRGASASLRLQVFASNPDSKHEARRWPVCFEQLLEEGERNRSVCQDGCKG